MFFLKIMLTSETKKSRQNKMFLHKTRSSVGINLKDRRTLIF